MDFDDVVDVENMSRSIALQMYRIFRPPKGRK